MFSTRMPGVQSLPEVEEREGGREGEQSCLKSETETLDMHIQHTVDGFKQCKIRDMRIAKEGTEQLSQLLLGSQ